jgi:hypothetical protein
MQGENNMVRALGLIAGVTVLVMAVVSFLVEWQTPPSKRRPW